MSWRTEQARPSCSWTWATASTGRISRSSLRSTLSRWSLTNAIPSSATSLFVMWKFAPGERHPPLCIYYFLNSSFNLLHFLHLLLPILPSFFFFLFLPTSCSSSSHSSTSSATTFLNVLFAFFLIIFICIAFLLLTNRPSSHSSHPCPHSDGPT